MAAAAKHLASVTLELGGKSPTIVDETANLDAAAKRIAMAKWANTGQMCLSPDYVFVHDKVIDRFIEKVKKNIKGFYGENIADSPSYARLVNDKRFRELKNLLENALSKGGKIVIGGDTDETQKYIEPTVITEVPEDAAIMREEIFGPVLPVFPYNDLNKVIEKINLKETPLGLYIYSKNRKNINKIINNTRAGGTCINHSAVHFYNNNLAFGGLNHSGIGRGHGYYGFEAFSNARGILKQWSPIGALDFVIPPYTNFKQKLIDFTIRWL
jgi:aldehyde dehydrogenase (NAD+)